MKEELKKRLSYLVYVAPVEPRIKELRKLSKDELIVELLETENSRIDADYNAMGDDL